MAYTDASLLGPGALFLNQYFNCPIPEQILLYIVCVSTRYDLFYLCDMVSKAFSNMCLPLCVHNVMHVN